MCLLYQRLLAHSVKEEEEEIGEKSKQPEEDAEDEFPILMLEQPGQRGFLTPASGLLGDYEHSVLAVAKLAR